MAVGVVDPFQLVDVEKEDGEALRRAAGPGDLLVDPFEKMPPVVETGQRIVACLTLERVVQLRHLEAGCQLGSDRRHKRDVGLGKGVSLLALGVEHPNHPSTAHQGKRQLGLDLVV